MEKEGAALAEPARVLRRFTGLGDEVGFFGLHWRAEHHFATALTAMHAFYDTHGQAARINALQAIAATLDQISTSVLGALPAHVDQHVFFHRLRLYLSVGEDVEYQGGFGRRSYTGASGAQSSMLQAVDSFVGVEPPAGELLTLSRDWAARRPLPHRQVVADLAARGPVRSLLLADRERDPAQAAPVIAAFNDLVDKAVAFRKAHLGLVREFLLRFAGGDARGSGGSAALEMLGSRCDQVAACRIPRDCEEGGSPSSPLEAAGTQVTPWAVSGRVDYRKLIDKFGCSLIDPCLLERFAAVIQRRTGKSGEPARPLHRLLRRGIVFSHRDLGGFLDAAERGEPIYLYTGRGPSGGMHIGHLLPFMFTKWLQEALGAHVVIQLTDDEKYLFRSTSFREGREMMLQNVREIIAVGFDPARTFIFSNFQYQGVMYPLIVGIQRLITHNQMRGHFGFDDSDNIGQWAFPPVQAAPSFSCAFPHLFPGDTDHYCLIPQAIDQDNYFRMTRDAAPRLGKKKPALIHSKFFPALQGPDSKMSSSDPTSSIFLSDTPEQIETKIMKYAFSGGQATKQAQREKGANLEVDVAYQLLVHFLEDDAQLQQIGEAYRSGQLLTSEVKRAAVACVQDLIRQHQAALAKVTQDDVDRYMHFDPSLQAVCPEGPHEA